MAYRYRDELFRFVMNGQSGRFVGQAPTSWRKIVLAALIVIVIVLFLFLIVGLISSR